MLFSPWDSAILLGFPGKIVIAFRRPRDRILFRIMEKFLSLGLIRGPAKGVR